MSADLARDRPAHQRHRRRAPDRRGVRPGTRRGSFRPDPVRRRRLSGCRRELRDRLRRDRRRRRPARGRAAVLGPARGRRDAPAGVAGRARRRRDVRPVARAGRADRRGPPGRPARADGLREPADRRRRRPRPGAGAGGGRRRRRDRRRPHARRGRAVRGASPREAGIAVVYLVAPTTAPERRAAVAARSGGFLYCVSLVGVTGARTSLPPTVVDASSAR